MSANIKRLKNETTTLIKKNLKKAFNNETGEINENIFKSVLPTKLQNILVNNLSETGAVPPLQIISILETLLKMKGISPGTYEIVMVKDNELALKELTETGTERVINIDVRLDKKERLHIRKGMLIVWDGNIIKEIRNYVLPIKFLKVLTSSMSSILLSVVTEMILSKIARPILNRIPKVRVAIVINGLIEFISELLALYAHTLILQKMAGFRKIIFNIFNKEYWKRINLIIKYMTRPARVLLGLYVIYTLRNLKNIIKDTIDTYKLTGEFAGKFDELMDNLENIKKRLNN